MNKLSYLLRSTVGASVTILALSGCGQSGSNFSVLPTAQSFKQGSKIANNKVDVLWVIDNSGSMSPLQTRLANNFGAFIGDMQAKNFDFKISVTTTDSYKADPTLVGYNSGNAWMAKFRDGTDATSHTGIFTIIPTTPSLQSVFITNATQGIGGSGDERAFSSFRTALNSPMNAGFLRSDSFLAVVILSDEDDFSGNGRSAGAFPDHSYSASTLESIGTYETYLNGLTGTSGASRRYSVSSLAILDAACLATYSATSPGTIIGQRYIQLAQATNGALGSICDANFAATLQAIQTSILELSTRFILDQIPVVSSIVVQVNGSLVANSAVNGWTYDSAANAIVFHGTAIPSASAAINVSFIPTTLTGG
jgi:hypothetical protein